MKPGRTGILEEMARNRDSMLNQVNKFLWNYPPPSPTIPHKSKTFLPSMLVLLLYFKCCTKNGVGESFIVKLSN